MKLLKFLNLLDQDDNISITSLGVYTLLVKIAIAPTLDWGTAAALLVTLLNYGHKRHVSASKANKDSTVVDSEIEQLKSKIEQFEVGHENLVKITEEAKKVISSSNIANAFTKSKR